MLYIYTCVCVLCIIARTPRPPPPHPGVSPRVSLAALRGSRLLAVRQAPPAPRRARRPRLALW